MRLFLLAVLLVLPAFFAAAEVALLRLRPSRVEVLVEEGQSGAGAVQRLQRRLRRALLVSQLGATLALVALGWAGRGLGGRLWADGAVGVAWRDTALFLGIVLLATLFAGLLPKAWVLNRPESSALRLVPLLEVVMRCLAPLLNLLEAVHHTRHARFPVIGQSLDDVRGVLDLRQMADPIARGELQADSLLEPYLEPAVRVLETSTLSELLPMIRSGQPLLLAVDEHGGTEGLVTAADLTGEIVGDDDPAASDEPDLLEDQDQPGAWMVAGDLEIFELNRQLDLDLPEADDHHTLAGFLLERLQHIPSPGEALRFNGLQFEITSMAGPRIERVRLVLPSSEALSG